MVRALRAWLCLPALLALSSAAPPVNTTTETTTSVDWVGRLRLDDAYLNPSGNARCPSKCRYYFAGASARDAVVCQKQASGVGTAQQNAEFGVTCFPAYGCGRDMITCVDRAWTEQLPNISDVHMACAGLGALVAENPWTCGSEAEGRPACNHDVPNNNIGKWLLADADLGCGWGSTYGGTVPNYNGDPTPFSSYFTVSDEMECCLRAMSFESSTWAEGGAALFFQLKGDQCRVDREKIIYANMDSSSGRSVKYQNTRCNSGRLFYRHAAGAADAANLHTGGRCVVDGGFKRLVLNTGATNLPQGEIYSMGAELPNHNCDPSDNSDGSCKSTLIMNTIADAEACCQQCRSLSWLPDVGGVVETDQNGNQVNPCVAWQIVEGRCRINLKHYYDVHNSGQTIEEALSDIRYNAPGNPGWLVSSRGCGSSMERCNYFSYIYYRELQDATDHPANANSTGNATYRKVVTHNISGATENITMQVKVSAIESRHDQRLSLLSSGADESDESYLAPGDGTDLGLVEVYARSSLRSSGDYEIFDEESEPVPLCSSELIRSNEEVTLTCAVGTSGRRLQEAGDVVFVFTAVGSGYDQVNFQAAATLEDVEDTTVSPTSTLDVLEETTAGPSSSFSSTSDGTSGGAVSTSNEGATTMQTDTTSSENTTSGFDEQSKAAPACLLLVVASTFL